MKEIRVFSNSNKFSLTEEVNNFIKSTEFDVLDIQYGVSSGLFSTEYSVMITIDSNEEK